MDALEEVEQALTLLEMLVLEDKTAAMIAEDFGLQEQWVSDSIRTLATRTMMVAPIAGHDGSVIPSLETVRSLGPQILQELRTQVHAVAAIPLESMARVAREEDLPVTAGGWRHGSLKHHQGVDAARADRIGRGDAQHLARARNTVYDAAEGCASSDSARRWLQVASQVTDGSPELIAAMRKTLRRTHKPLPRDLTLSEINETVRTPWVEQGLVRLKSGNPNVKRDVAMVLMNSVCGVYPIELAQLQIKDVITPSGQPITKLLLRPGVASRGRPRQVNLLGSVMWAAIDLYLAARFRKGQGVSARPGNTQRDAFRGMDPYAPLFLTTEGEAYQVSRRSSDDPRPRCAWLQANLRTAHDRCGWQQLTSWQVAWLVAGVMVGKGCGVDDVAKHYGVQPRQIKTRLAQVSKLLDQMQRHNAALARQASNAQAKLAVHQTNSSEIARLADVVTSGDQIDARHVQSSNGA